jgi:uncharacterized protein (UPF0332 family)
MDPEEFLDLAGEWITGTRQGEWRSAASRAYYAAFHAARRVLIQGGFRVPEAGQAHGYVWLRLQNAGQADIVEAARRLQIARSWRNKADYDLDTPLPEEDAMKGFNAASDAFHVLTTLAGEPAVLARVVDAIRAYEVLIGDVTWHGTP